MQTRIGDLTITLLQETDQSAICYANMDLLDRIATLSGLGTNPHRRKRVLQAIGRDERFTNDYIHIPIGNTERRVRVFFLTPPKTSPAQPIELPADPWLRRVFVGIILDLDPHAVTPSHSAAVAVVLPEAMQRLTTKQHQRICATYGMAGIERQRQTDQAHEAQRKRVTIRNSVRHGIHQLATYIRAHIPPIILPAPTATMLGDPLFWERVDCAGSCWTWQGALDHGSPTFKRNGKKHQARRYLYELYHGPIPLEHRIVVFCGADRCVRPEYLEAIHARDAFELRGVK